MEPVIAELDNCAVINPDPITAEWTVGVSQDLSSFANNTAAARQAHDDAQAAADECAGTMATAQGFVMLTEATALPEHLEAAETLVQE